LSYFNRDRHMKETRLSRTLLTHMSLGGVTSGSSRMPASSTRKIVST
jgi:hypothetical protein